MTGLKRRLIPKLLIKNERFGKRTRPILVTTTGFEETTPVGDPVSQAKVLEAQKADELIVLNINAASQETFVSVVPLIERLAAETFMPLTVGGGIATLDDIALLIGSGADKVSLNDAIFNTPELISKASRQFGSQSVVVSIDFKTGNDGVARVFRHSAQAVLDTSPVELAQKAVELGAGEILLTDVDRDGKGKGLNCAVGKSVASAVDVPMTISGGCGVAQHFIEGFQATGAEGVAAGTFFCLRDQNLMQTRAHLLNAGIPARSG